MNKNSFTAENQDIQINFQFIYIEKIGWLDVCSVHGSDKLLFVELPCLKDWKLRIVFHSLALTSWSELTYIFFQIDDSALTNSENSVVANQYNLNLTKNSIKNRSLA